MSNKLDSEPDAPVVECSDDKVNGEEIQPTEPENQNHVECDDDATVVVDALKDWEKEKEELLSQINSIKKTNRTKPKVKKKKTTTKTKKKTDIDRIERLENLLLERKQAAYSLQPTPIQPIQSIQPIQPVHLPVQPIQPFQYQPPMQPLSYTYAYPSQAPTPFHQSYAHQSPYLHESIRPQSRLSYK